eukprot:5781993-Amphidinium_carterae.1
MQCAPLRSYDWWTAAWWQDCQSSWRSCSSSASCQPPKLHRSCLSDIRELAAELTANKLFSSTKGNDGPQND